MSIERTGFGQGRGNFTGVACEFGDLVARKGLLARGRHDGGMPNGQQRCFQVMTVIGSVTLGAACMVVFP